MGFFSAYFRREQSVILKWDCTVAVIQGQHQALDLVGSSLFSAHLSFVLLITLFAPYNKALKVSLALKNIRHSSAWEIQFMFGGIQRSNSSMMCSLFTNRIKAS